MINGINCNEAQERAIIHNTGPMLVIAGPGSGKTFTITHRIKYLIECHGVSPTNILVITFSKAAAKEMKERAHKTIGEHAGHVTFGTFHSVFYQILKKSFHYPEDSLLRDDMKYQVIKEFLEQESFETDDINETIHHLILEISLYKNSMKQIEEFECKNFEKEIFCKLMKAYESYLNRARKIDFDDMLLKCFENLCKYPEKSLLWKERFLYILIDEFQDVNQLQFETIKILAGESQNLFVVGDDDQSIYGFRGAKPEIMLSFEEAFQNVKKVLLNVNYRSQKCIVEGALRVIEHNESRFSKEILADKAERDPISVLKYKDREEELKSVITYLLDHKEEQKDTAIIVRTNSSASYIASMLLQYHIPFTTREQIPDIYANFLAKDLFHYCRIAMGEKKRGQFYGIMNRPKRYLTRGAFLNDEVSFQELYRYYADKPYMQNIIEKFEKDINWLAKMRPYSAINYILKGIGYEEYLKEHAKSRRINFNELRECAYEIRERSKPFASFQEWFEHIENYEEEMKQRKQENKDQNEEGVSIVTIHVSKGLEYGTVFILACNEGNMPYKKATTKEEIEEERRMFYVAMTRAKEKLFLSYIETSHEKSVAPSRFLNDFDIKKEQSKTAP